jgi:hypothetical protein
VAQHCCCAFHPNVPQPKRFSPVLSAPIGIYRRPKIFQLRAAHARRNFPLAFQRRASYILA